jgi:eukaryotic-like serine/threonine-protein kinase
MSGASNSDFHRVGRYALHGVLAAGGMATIHVGRLLGEKGFARTVAIKRLHPQFATDPQFRTMFLEEARLAGRIRHTNVVSVVDVVSSGNELLLVMDYVHGEVLSRLIKRAGHARIDPAIVVAIVANLLDGLHAAHETRDELGRNLDIVHRDISPQNVVVGADGVARVLDFGIAKAAGQAQNTQEGQLKGKLAYMAPEQFHGQLSRQVDVYAAGIVLWEALAGRRLFLGSNEGETIGRILRGDVPLPSKYGSPVELDSVVLRALSADLGVRYSTAHQMMVAMTQQVQPAPTHVVASWVNAIAEESLRERAEMLSSVETSVSNFAALEAHAVTLPPQSVRPPKPRGRAIWPFAVGVAAASFTGAMLYLWQRPPRTAGNEVPGLATTSASPTIANPATVSSEADDPYIKTAVAATASVHPTANATSSGVGGWNSSRIPRSLGSTPPASLVATGGAKPPKATPPTPPNSKPAIPDHI